MVLRRDFWQLCDLKVQDIVSADAVILVDNAVEENCPEDIKDKCRLRWRPGSGSDIALVPEFSDRIEEFLPEWLISAVEKGNVELKFEIDAESPDLIVPAAVSAIHYFLKKRAKALYNTALCPPLPLFPGGVAPAARTECDLSRGRNNRTSFNPGRRVVLWAVRPVRGNDNHSRGFEDQFISLDAAWFRYLVILENRLDEKLKSEEETEDRDLLLKKFLFQAVYPFLVLSPCVDPGVREEFISDLDLYTCLSPGRGLGRHWTEMETVVRNSEFDQELEKEIMSIIHERGGYGADTVPRIAEFAGKWVPELFGGGAIDFGEELTEAARTARIERSGDWPVGIFRLTLTELFLFYLYFERYHPRQLEHFSGQRERILAYDMYSPPQENEAPLDPAEGANIQEANSIPDLWRQGFDILPGRFHENVDFQMSEGRGLLNALYDQGVLDQISEYNVDRSSKMNLVRGYHWLRKAPGGLQGSSAVPGQTTEVWPEGSLHIETSDISSRGAAGFRIEIINKVSGEDSVPGKISVSAQIEMNEDDLKKMWKKVHITVHGQPRGQFPKNQVPVIIINKGENQPHRLTENEMKKCGFTVSNAKKFKLRPFCDLLLKVSPAEPADQSPQYIEHRYSPESDNQQRRGSEKSRIKKQIENLRRALSKYTGYSSTSTGQSGNGGVPIRSHPEERRGEILKYPIDFRVTIRNPSED